MQQCSGSSRLDKGRVFSCAKYFLIICNLFFFILSIFNALFGIAYQDKKWPGGYTGGQMAIFSLFVMCFTTVGFCGASYHKAALLFVYGCSILAFAVGGLIFWLITNDLSDVQFSGRLVFFVLALLVLIFTSFYLAVSNNPNPNVSQIFRFPSILSRDGSFKESFKESKTSINMGITNPCPVPGCNAPCPIPECTYGKVMTPVTIAKHDSITQIQAQCQPTMTCGQQHQTQHQTPPQMPYAQQIQMQPPPLQVSLPPTACRQVTQVQQTPTLQHQTAPHQQLLCQDALQISA